MRRKNTVLGNGMELIQWEDNNMPIVIYNHPREENLMTVTHWHKELEVTCMFDGETEFLIDGAPSTLRAGEACVINSEALHYARVKSHSLQNAAGDIGVTIQFRMSFLESLIPDISDYAFVISGEETMRKIAEDMGKIYQFSKKVDENEFRLRCIAAVYDLLIILYTECRREKELVPVSASNEKDRIKQIIYYLNEHYAENLTEKELASRFYFSREHFSRFFKQHTGITLKDYLTRYRVGKAEQLLRTTDKKVLDIALETGFTNEAQLISWFKRMYSETPAKYRRNITQKSISQNHITNP